MIRRLVAIIVVAIAIAALIAVLYVERSGSGPPPESRAIPLSPTESTPQVPATGPGYNGIRHYVVAHSRTPPWLLL